MTSQMHIRPYDSRDEKTIWTLNEQTPVPGMEDINRSTWYEDLRTPEQSYIAPGGAFLVGECKHHHEWMVVAMGGLMPLPDDIAELKRIRVHPDFKGQNFAKKIIEALEEEARQGYFEILCAHTTPEQTAMQHIFERLGYHKTGEAPVNEKRMVHFLKALHVL